MKRSEILNEAAKCVCGQREQDYGKPEDNFTTIGDMWVIYLEAAHPYLKKSNISITAKDVAVMMALLKVARIATGHSPDSFVDLAGYAACAGEIDALVSLGNIYAVSRDEIVKGVELHDFMKYEEDKTDEC